MGTTAAERDTGRDETETNGAEETEEQDDAPEGFRTYKLNGKSEVPAPLIGMKLYFPTSKGRGLDGIRAQVHGEGGEEVIRKASQSTIDIWRQGWLRRMAAELHEEGKSAEAIQTALQEAIDTRFYGAPVERTGGGEGAKKAKDENKALRDLAKTQAAMGNTALLEQLKGLGWTGLE